MFKKEDIKAVLMITAALAAVFYHVWVATGPQ